MEAKYDIKAIPSNKKTWRQARSLDITVKLNIEGKETIFKGKATV